MPAVTAAIFLRAGKVLLARRALHRRSFPNTWDLIGGHLEPGETIEQAMVRECEEEIGLTPTEFVSAGELPEAWQEPDGAVACHMFVVTAWRGGEPRLIGDEHTELRWFSIGEACALPDLALDGYKTFLRAQM